MYQALDGDSRLRRRIAQAIIRAFDRHYQEGKAAPMAPATVGNYDPDTCYEAADEVIAELVGEMTGEDFVAVRGPVIGPAKIAPRSVAEGLKARRPDIQT